MQHSSSWAPRRWVGSVRRVLGARAIRGSNSIEGFNVSVEDALAAIEGGEPAEAAADDWMAVRGYRRAMTYVIQLAHDEHFEFTPSLVRSLHFMMTSTPWMPAPVYGARGPSGFGTMHPARSSTRLPRARRRPVSSTR